MAKTSKTNVKNKASETSVAKTRKDAAPKSKKAAAAKKTAAAKPVKKAAAVKKAPAKKPVKPAVTAKKAAKTVSAAGKAPAKKPVKPAVTAKKPVKPAPAAKKPLAAKKVKAAPAVKETPAAKKEKKTPPKMKKMVVKTASAPVQEEIFENASKEFAFAFAESMKKEQLAADVKTSKEAEARAIRLTKRPTSRSRGGDTLKFSDSDLAQFRKSLIQIRQSIVGKTATLKTNALEQTIDRAGEDEDGSDSFMRLQNLGQVGEQNKTLQKIDEALHRIEDGTYGICEVCGQLIRKARLQHLPFAHTCMECQSEMEANRGTRG